MVGKEIEELLRLLLLILLLLLLLVLILLLLIPLLLLIDTLLLLINGLLLLQEARPRARQVRTQDRFYRREAQRDGVRRRSKWVVKKGRRRAGKAFPVLGRSRCVRRIKT